MRHGEGGDSQRLGEGELLDSNDVWAREMRQNEREKRKCSYTQPPEV